MPDLRDRVLPRPALLDRLDSIPTRPLTFVTGPAGSGKTVLLASWSRNRCGLPVAWIGAAGSDVVDTLIAAIADVAGIVLPESADLLDKDTGRLGRQGAARLRAALDGAPDVVVVVDGIDTAEAAEACADVAAAVERADACGVHLALSGRHLPSRDTVSLLLRGTAEHIDADDLRIDAGEVASVVALHADRALPAATAEQLCELLDGWVAGAVFVGLAHRRGRHDRSAEELADAALEDIESYVMSEVVQREPDDVREFLMLTACLDEIDAHVCDAITGRSDSERLLVELQARGVPIKRVRSRTATYRYAPPLRAVLDLQARRQMPAAHAGAVRVAADWFTMHGRPLDAAECLIRLDEWGSAIDVMMLHLQRNVRGSELSGLADLVAKAPPALLREQSHIALKGAWVMRMDGRIGAAYELLAMNEQMSPAARVVADVARSAVAAWVDDMDGVLRFAEAAVERCAELGDDAFADTPSLKPVLTTPRTDSFSAIAHGNALQAAAYGGLWDSGGRHLVDVSAQALATLPQMQVVQLFGNRATFLALSGRAAEAALEAHRALAAAAESGLHGHPVSAEAHYALAEARRLRLEHAEATDLLERALELATSNRRGNLVAAIVAAQSHLLVDAGKPQEAAALVEQHRAGARHVAPRTLAGALAAAEARAHAAMADHRRGLRALDLAAETAVTATVRVIITVAAGELARARETVARWPGEATPDSAVRRALSAAVVFDSMSDLGRARASFRVALARAADHQLLQPFVEFGPLVERLLRRVDASDVDTAVMQLARRVEAALTGGGGTVAAARFTARETMVFSRLAEGWTIPQVAQHAHLSVNTVKTHVKAIYRKLGANSRVDAVRAWNTIQARHQGS